MILRIVLSVAVAAAMLARSPEVDRARDLYQRTEYRQSLDLLLTLPARDPGALQLIGENYFMLGEYKKATDALDKAAAIEPNDAVLMHWLGRAYGRRAETSNPFSAPGLASKSRQFFEKSVELDPTNKAAVGDLLDYYLEAPGFLGGGTHKAEALARLIGQSDPAEGHYAQAMIDDKKKEYDAAEQQLRHAAELAPRQVGRILALAKYLAKRGSIKESDQLFDQALRLAPDNPRILFDRADAYIREKRNLPAARELLERYLTAPLTPDDPPRERAQELLKKTGS